MRRNRNFSSCRAALVSVALLYLVAAADAKISDDTNGLPLKPERTLSFSTTEGTWLSLDVSPDGKRIVFDLLGHLYVLPIEGGEAKQITRGMGFDSQPRYSPDGSMIVFVDRK